MVSREEGLSFEKHWGDFRSKAPNIHFGNAVKIALSTLRTPVSEGVAGLCHKVSHTPSDIVSRKCQNFINRNEVQNTFTHTNVNFSKQRT